MYLLPRSGLAVGEDQIQLFSGGCVGGLDGVDIDLARGCRIGVTEAGGDGGDRDAGVDHQRGVGMSEAVDGDVRQIVRTDEVAEPTADGVGVDRRTVRLGEQPVAISPTVTHREPSLCLPTFVLLEQLNRYRRGFDVAGGAVVLRRLGDDPLVRDVQRGALDADDGGLEVDVLPFESAEFLPAHTREHEHLDHRLELHIFALDQLQKPAGLFLVQVARAGLFLFREGCPLTWIARNESPLDGDSQNRREKTVVVADGIVGERLVLAIGGEGLAHRELQRLADGRRSFLANTPAAQRVTQGGWRHTGDTGKLLGCIAALFEELFEVDLTFVMDLSADAFPELVAVEQGDLLRSNTIDAKVAETFVHDLRHVAIADDSFLFEVQLGVGVEVLLDEFRELHAAALGDLTGLAFLLKENGLTLYLFLDLLGGHALVRGVGHGAPDLLAVHIVAAGHHDEVTVVALSDGRHVYTSLS